MKFKINSVSNQDSKIQFEITLTGEWDWNQDFVRQPPGYPSLFDDPSFSDHDNFEQAITQYVQNFLKTTCGQLFEKVELSRLNISNCVLQEFDRARSNLKQQNKEKLKNQILKHEKKIRDLLNR